MGQSRRRTPRPLARGGSHALAARRNRNRSPRRRHSLLTHHIFLVLLQRTLPSSPPPPPSRHLPDQSPPPQRQRKPSTIPQYQHHHWRLDHGARLPRRPPLATLHPRPTVATTATATGRDAGTAVSLPPVFSPDYPDNVYSPGGVRAAAVKEGKFCSATATNKHNDSNVWAAIGSVGVCLPSSSAAARTQWWW